MGPGPLVLFPFVVLAILMAIAFICVKDISGTTLPRNLKFCTLTSMTRCIMGKKIRAMGPGPLELFPFVVLAILMAMAFLCVKDFLGTTLPRNLKCYTHDKYHSCIVGKKKRAMGPGPVELFPFVVLAILMAMAFLCVKDFLGTTLPRNLKCYTHDKYD